MTTEFEKKTQIDCFGCTVESMLKSKPAFVDTEMYAVQILSDAQEELSRGNGEIARQYINKAKYFISLLLQEKRRS